MRLHYLILILCLLGHHHSHALELETQQSNSSRNTLFAIKTNLLLDAVLCPNIELEIPIGKHWSVCGEWIFPWWLSNEKQNCLQLQAGNIEGRYWFCPPEKTRERLLCWFTGIYLGAGYYDFESKKTGYQGEFQNIGVLAGFTHRISNRFHLEYSLGVGFLQTKYRKYTAEEGYDDRWYLIRTKTQPQKIWFGPTRAKISLVWMLTKKSKKGTEL